MRDALNVVRSFATALFVSLLACAGPLADGKAEFTKGRFAEAKTTFVRLEIESRAWDDSRRAEYALYRGLTHGALGEREAAGVWLREAKAVENLRAGTLSAEDRARLERGLRQLGGSQ